MIVRCDVPLVVLAPGAGNRVEEVPDIGDAVLEQVADALGVARQQVGRVLLSTY